MPIFLISKRTNHEEPAINRCNLPFPILPVHGANEISAAR